MECDMECVMECVMDVSRVQELQQQVQQVADEGKTAQEQLQVKQQEIEVGGRMLGESIGC